MKLPQAFRCSLLLVNLFAPSMLLFAQSGGSYVRLDSVATTTTLLTYGALYNPWIMNYQNTLIGPWAPPSGGVITRFHVTQQTDWWTDIFTVYDAYFNILWSKSDHANQWVSISGGTTELWTRLGRVNTIG